LFRDCKVEVELILEESGSDLEFGNGNSKSEIDELKLGLTILGLFVGTEGFDVGRESGVYRGIAVLHLEQRFRVCG
jgi:hypothetical protein